MTLVKDDPGENVPGGAGDLWSHRNTEMICASCMFYTNFRCRRHAPTLNGWPAVYPRDWCGDHKLDKERMRGI